MSEVKNEVLSLDNLNVQNLTELAGWEQKQNEIVAENPFVEIIDNPTWEQAKKHRTALVKARTTIEGQDKLIASKLAAFRKSVKDKSDELIAITLPHETKQQDEVKRYEAIKENERLERERLELERVNKIKGEVARIESECYAVIQKMTFAEIDEVQDYITKATNTDFDFEEYEILFKQASQRVVNIFNEKQSDLIEKEQQRAENERLRAENEEANRKAAELEAEIAKERSEREKKEREEKEKVFEVRKSRLSEVGFTFVESVEVFQHPDLFMAISKLSIYEADTIDFENILTDAKNGIEISRKEKSEQEAESARQKEAASKAEKETKTRQKKLAGDKKLIEAYIEGISLPDSYPALKKDEFEFFLIELDSQLSDFKNQAIKNLNNL